MTTQDLATVAQRLVAAPRGILAVDESVATIGRRFETLGISGTAENRRDYRELLIGTPGLSAWISGAILHDETIRQSASDGTPFPALLDRQGLMSGIKVDTGARELALHPGEKVTEGLDGLRERIAEYREMGASFAKWRAVITIGAARPSAACLGANAHGLARYAALCQEGGLVPIVEPEVLMDGDHTIERCLEVTEATLRRVFDELAEQGVALDGIVLKPSMVIAGRDAVRRAPVLEVAEATLSCLRRVVPPSVPGVAFLSGGQSAELASEHLNAINTLGDTPWQLTFSYGRALQDPALAGWRGQATNRDAARSALARRSRNNSAACTGQYSTEMEPVAVGQA